MKRALALAALLLSIGCNSSPRSPLQAETAKKGAAERVDVGKSASASSRMIIRTAALSLVVGDAADSLRAAIAVVERHGGYVAATRLWRENGQIRATATLRIPAENLSDALPEIRKGAIRVDSESVTGQDVSEEFSDLGAQLTNLQATEQELRQLLGTVRERTQKASDVLEVYEKLTTVRGEIDRIQGKMNFLKQMTAMSTINLELIPDILSTPIVEPGFRPLAIAKTAARSLVATSKWLATGVIWIVVFVLPLGLAIALAAASGRSLWNSLRRWRGNPGKLPPETPPRSRER